MKFNKRLNANNFPIYAIKNWLEEENVTTKELNKDLKIFSYIGKSLKKYYNTSNINIRIVLNQITQLNNVFGPVASVRLLFFYYDASYHSTLKTMLEFLGPIPKKIPEADLPAIPEDPNMVKLLRELFNAGN